MGLMSNGFRIYWPDTVEGSAHALLPGQFDSLRQFQKCMVFPDGATTANKVTAAPTGYYNNRCYHPPVTDGEASMRLAGAGDMTATGYAAKLGEIDFTGLGDMEATAGLVVSAILALVGSGSLTLQAQGQLNASLDFTGSGDMTALASGIANALMDFTGTGDLDSLAMGYANATLDITVTGTGLTTANVGQAVWSALASANNDPGTMGELMNAAGGGSSPEIIAQAVLDAMVEGGVDVQATLRRLLALASGDGTFPQTGAFEMKSQDGMTVRIAGTVDSAGTRTITAIDDG